MVLLRAPETHGIGPLIKPSGAHPSLIVAVSCREWAQFSARVAGRRLGVPPLLCIATTRFPRFQRAVEGTRTAHSNTSTGRTALVNNLIWDVRNTRDGMTFFPYRSVFCLESWSDLSAAPAAGNASDALTPGSDRESLRRRVRTDG
jgi:hypothetical protein